MTIAAIMKGLDTLRVALEEKAANMDSPKKAEAYTLAAASIDDAMHTLSKV